MQHLLWIGLGFAIVAFLVRMKTGKARRRIVRDHLREGATVLDVRTAEEYDADHYEHALNIPLHILHGKLGMLGTNKKQPVILYCDSGMRSGSAAIILMRAGFRHVHNAGTLNDVRRAAADLDAARETER